MSNSIKVYFNIKSHYRKRQQETTEQLPKGIKAIVPVAKFVEDYDIRKVYASGIVPFALKVLRKLPMINARLIRDKKLDNADFAYSYGTILLNNKNYILELDTPLILTLYNTHTMENPLARFVIKKMLKSKTLKTIVCISEACRKLVGKIFKDNEISGKSVVVYPYIKNRSITKEKRTRKDRIVILHVGYNFYLKGGRELLKAFEILCKNHKEKNLKLIMVCNVPAEVKEKYGKMKNIEFVEPKMKKEDLFKKYYTKADIFVMPTNYDSFNMTVLEAISSGLPVIATKMFAIPEMVIDSYNGLLMDMAVDYYKTDFMPNDKYWNIDLAEYLKGQEYPKLVEEIVKKTGILIKNEKLRKKMSNNSLKLVKEKFSGDVRNKKLVQIFRIK